MPRKLIGDIQTGTIVGDLTVIERDKNPKNTHDVYWKCRCKCGNTTSITSSDIRRKHKKSCGCWAKYSNGEGNLKSLYSNYRLGAIKRNLSFELTLEQFNHITKSNCYWCGAIPKQIFFKPGSNGDYVYNGIDRKDNLSGYTLENSVPCCGTCNIGKMRQSETEFLTWVQRIYRHKKLWLFNKQGELIRK